MKKRVILLLALLILAGVLVWAGGKQEPEAEAPTVVEMEFENSWENFKDDPIALTLFADSPTFEAEKFMKYDTLIPRLTREETGVTLDIREAVDSSPQSLNLLIASGDYPDIMFIDFGDHTIEAANLIEHDQIWSYDDLKEKYGIDVLRHLGINQRFNLRSTFMKDEIYFANSYGLRDEYYDSPWLVKWQVGAYMNEKLYKEVGAPPINSFDDLMDAVEKIKARHPRRVEYGINITRGTGDGDFGEPAEFETLIRFYGLNDPRNYWQLGGKHKFYFQAPAFLDLLKDFNEMVNRGFLSPIIWTGSKDDKWGQLFAGSAVVTLNGDADNLLKYNSAIQIKFPDERYIMLPPFPGDPKYEYTAAGKIGAGGPEGWAIPKGGKNTLRALAFVDYMMSEHFQKLNQFGREGKEHTVVDGMPKLLPEVAKMGDTDIAGEYYLNILHGSIRDSYWAMVDRQRRQPSMLEGIKVLKPCIEDFRDLTFVPEAVNAPYPQDSEELKIRALIAEAFGDGVVRIVQGPPDKVESEYRKLMQQLESMGLSKLNAFQQEAAENFAKLVEKYKD